MGFFQRIVSLSVCHNRLDHPNFLSASIGCTNVVSEMFSPSTLIGCHQRSGQWISDFSSTSMSLSRIFVAWLISHARSFEHDAKIG